MVHGDIEEFIDVLLHHATKVVDQGLACGDGHERVDDVVVYDVREFGAMLGETPFVIA
jgi:hypothetical protein